MTGPFLYPIVCILEKVPKMKNSILVILFVLFAFACSANVEGSDPEPCPKPEVKAPVCAPIQKCMAREAGYVWAGLQTGKVGECTFYRYNCMPEGEPANEECEQRWETVCAPGDVDGTGGGE